MTSTRLTLTGIGLPPFSVRGATQTLEPLDAAKQTRRTINGELVDLGLDQFKKLKSTISCSDMDAPALDGVYPGAVVTVGCALELASLSGALSRTAVADSVRVADGFTFYRPELTMMVVNFTSDFDEWACSYSWTIELEEV